MLHNSRYYGLVKYLLLLIRMYAKDIFRLRFDKLRMNGSKVFF